MKKNSKVTAATTLLSLATIILLVAGFTSTPPLTALATRLGGGEEGEAQ